MKFMVVVLAAVASVQAAPEADPQVLYSGLSGYNLPYLGGYNNLALNNLAYNAAPLAPLASRVAPLLPVARAVSGPALPVPVPAPLAPTVVEQVAPAVIEQVAPVTQVVQPASYALPTPAIAPAVLPAPAVRAVSPIAPIAPIARAVAPIAPIAPVVRAYGPRDCVTRGGCAAAQLRDLGLARKKRESESDSDAGVIAPIAAGPLANPLLAYNTLGYNNLAYNFPYTGLNSAIAPALYNGVGAAVVPADVAPVQTVVEAPIVAPVAEVPAVLPQPIAQAVVPAPVVRATPAVIPQPIVRATPAVIPQPIVRAATPVVAARPPIVEPIVASRTKKVTYTHLGAHPVRNPNGIQVLETETGVIGHRVF